MQSLWGTITGLRHVGIATPKYDECRAFYAGPWGLELTAEHDGVAYFGARAGGEPYIVRVRKDAQKRLDLFAFAAASRASVDALASHMTKAGLRIEREPGELQTPGGGYGFRFFDCDGRLMEVSADVAPRPLVELPTKLDVPRKLSHGVLNSPDPAATAAFYQEHLGLRLSDWLADVMCFMRCGPQHHILAISRGPYSSLNHISFEMGDLDLYLRGTGRMMRLNGRKPIWGPGRHAAGDNAFSYFFDPAGNIVEYTTELETVDERSWKSRTFETSPEASDLWGTGGSPFEEMIPAMKNDVDPGLWRSAPV